MISGNLNSDVEELRKDKEKVEDDWSKVVIDQSKLFSNDIIIDNVTMPTRSIYSEINQGLNDVKEHLSDFEKRTYSSLRRRKDDINMHDKHLKQLGQDSMNHGYRINELEKDFKKMYWQHLSIQLLLFIAILVIFIGLIELM